MMTICSSSYLERGMVALFKNGKIVWAGYLSSPWEDVEVDTIFLSKADYDEVALRTLPNGRVIP